MDPLSPQVDLVPAVLAGMAGGVLLVTVWVLRDRPEPAVAVVLWLLGALVAVPTGAAAGAAAALWWDGRHTPPEVELARQLVADCSPVVDVDPQAALQLATAALRDGTADRVAQLAAGVDATRPPVPEAVADDGEVVGQLESMARARRESGRFWCRRWFAGP